LPEFGELNIETYLAFADNFSAINASPDFLIPAATLSPATCLREGGQQESSNSLRSACVPCIRQPACPKMTFFATGTNSEQKENDNL